MLYELHPWKHSRSACTGFSATWLSWERPCSVKGDWTSWSSEVPSNPKRSRILSLYDSAAPPSLDLTRIFCLCGGSPAAGCFRWRNIALFWPRTEMAFFGRAPGAQPSLARVGAATERRPRSLRLGRAPWRQQRAESSSHSSVSPAGMPGCNTAGASPSPRGWKYQGLVPPQPGRWFSSASPIQGLGNREWTAQGFSYARMQACAAKNHKLMLLDIRRLLGSLR